MQLCSVAPAALQPSGRTGPDRAGQRATSSARGGDRLGWPDGPLATLNNRLGDIGYLSTQIGLKAAPRGSRRLQAPSQLLRRSTKRRRKQNILTALRLTSLIYRYKNNCIDQNNDYL